MSVIEKLKKTVFIYSFFTYSRLLNRTKVFVITDVDFFSKYLLKFFLNLKKGLLMTYFLRKPIEKNSKVHVPDCSYCNCRFCRSIRRQKTTSASLTKVPVDVLKRYNYCLWSFKYRQLYDIEI